MSWLRANALNPVSRCHHRLRCTFGCQCTIIYGIFFDPMLMPKNIIVGQIKTTKAKPPNKKSTSKTPKKWTYRLARRQLGLKKLEAAVGIDHTLDTPIAKKVVSFTKRCKLTPFGAIKPCITWSCQPSQIWGYLPLVVSSIFNATICCWTQCTAFIIWLSQRRDSRRIYWAQALRLNIMSVWRAKMARYRFA